MTAPVIIKNVKTAPPDADNDGATRIACSCVVFTTADDAAVQAVEIDLSPLGGAKRQPLKLDRRERLPASREGEYATHFAVPALTDPGRYELRLSAVDDGGNHGAARAAVEVRYRRPAYSGGPLAPDNQRALEKIAGAPITSGNRVEALAEGGPAMNRRLELLAGATKQINLQTYLFDRDVGGARFYNELLARFNAGVQANIILNADTQIPAALLSTLRLSFHNLLTEISEFFEALRPTNHAERDMAAWQKRLAEWKHSVNLILVSGARLRERGLAPLRRGEPPAVWLRKLLADAARDPLASPPPAVAPPASAKPDSGAWGRDEMFQGPGGLPAVPLVDYATHEKILVVDGARAIVGGRNLTDDYFDHWLDVDLLLEGPAVGQVQNGFFRSFQEFADDSARRTPPTPARARNRAAGPSRVQFVQSRPWNDENATLRTLVAAFQMAQRRIFIYSQYLVLPDSLLLDALLDAARRGVDVRILTNSEATAQAVNFAAGHFITLNYLPRLLDAGVRVFLLDGDLQAKGPRQYLHVKEFLIDGQLAVFGSFNLSIRSCFVESENLVNVFDPAIAAAEEAVFLQRTARQATEATPRFVAEQFREHRARIEIARALELLF
jgi:phosphatidylserine/phosphatidylglycerophosphate/cardiolipin synthase-like enzyme